MYLVNHNIIFTLMEHHFPYWNSTRESSREAYSAHYSSLAVYLNNIAAAISCPEVYLLLMTPNFRENFQGGQQD